MTSSHHEQQRLRRQAELDAAKTGQERNRLGQFATPTRLARDILDHGLGLLPAEAPIRFLDPALGTGAFYSALLACRGQRIVSRAQGYEIDPHYGEPAQALWQPHGLSLELGDFTRAEPPEAGFNLLICNPPYVRHHHLALTEKRRLQAEILAATGLKLSGLTGFYGHFLLMADRWLGEDGVAGWLIPSEFMDVNYGRELKRYLLEQVTLLRIHRFDPADVQFDDALVSSAVVWFAKRPPPADHTVEFSFGGSHAEPALSRRIPAKALAGEAKWTRFPLKTARDADDSTILADLFEIRRGIATGGNEFFILNRERIEALKLPMECFRPILPSPRHLHLDEIEADEQGDPLLPEPLFLLDCRLPEEEVRERYPTLWAYLESGKPEIASRYLCRARQLWYRQEKRLPAPVICTYMGRSASRTGRPFRFLLNHSQAIVANTYLMLYPKPTVAERLQAKPEAMREIWRLLNEIPPESMAGEGRVYGGGLHKIEPKELAKVPAGDIARVLDL